MSVLSVGRDLAWELWTPRRRRVEATRSRRAITKPKLTAHGIVPEVAFLACGDHMVRDVEGLSFDDLDALVDAPVQITAGPRDSWFILVADRPRDGVVRVLVQGFRPQRGFMRHGNELYLKGFRIHRDGRTKALSISELHHLRLSAESARERSSRPNAA
jgi:hypothetical protein